VKGIDAAPDACKLKPIEGEMGGGVWSMVPGGGGRGGPGGLGVTRGGGGWSGRPVEVQFWWK
jgi:hypothetical protein